ncbi:hypothetical protein HDV00_001333, partial [Rhizophlyctis rosea]
MSGTEFSDEPVEQLTNDSINTALNEFLHELELGNAQLVTPPVTRPSTPLLGLSQEAQQAYRGYSLAPTVREEEMEELGMQPGASSSSHALIKSIDMERVVGNVKIWTPDNTHVEKAANALDEFPESEDVLPQKWLDDYGADVFAALHTMHEKSNLPKAHQDLLHSIVARSFKHQKGDLSRLLSSGTSAIGGPSKGRKSKDPDVVEEAKRREMEKRVVKYASALLNYKAGVNPFQLPKSEFSDLQTRFRSLSTLKPADAFSFDMNF